MWACRLAAAATLAVSASCSPAPAAPPAEITGASRIVTLAPHLAELVYAGGAGDRLVGTVEFSDFPPAVRHVKRVGDAFRVDYEAVITLHPDLILGWTSGNPPETLERLRSLGFRVVTFETAELADVARHLEEIGALAGTGTVAAVAAARFRERLAALQTREAGAAPLRVFVELAARPYFTVTDRHFLGQGLRLCGGHNVFGDLRGLTAVVSLESIVDAAPEVIIASDMAGDGDSPLGAWQSWPDLPAVRRGLLYALDADLLSRPGTRILDGVENLCRVLDEARAAPGGRP